MAIFDHKRLVNEPNRGSVLQLYLIRLTVVLCGSNAAQKWLNLAKYGNEVIVNMFIKFRTRFVRPPGKRLRVHMDQTWTV